MTPSVFSNIRHEMKDQSSVVQNILKRKVDKLSERQCRPLRIGSRIIFGTVDGGELPKFVFEVLSKKLCEGKT